MMGAPSASTIDIAPMTGNMMLPCSGCECGEGVCVTCHEEHPKCSVCDAPACEECREAVSTVCGACKQPICDACVESVGINTCAGCSMVICMSLRCLRETRLTFCSTASCASSLCGECEAKTDGSPQMLAACETCGETHCAMCRSKCTATGPAAAPAGPSSSRLMNDDEFDQFWAGMPM